jgi:hypothetical protein
LRHLPLLASAAAVGGARRASKLGSDAWASVSSPAAVFRRDKNAASDDIGDLDF